jgi:hypothetical protein
MGGQIGGIATEFDLYWVTRFEGRPVASDAVALDGTTVTVYVTTSPYRGLHTFKFSWITQAQLDTLRSYHANPGAIFTIKASAEEPAVSGRFGGEGRISFQPVAGSPDSGISHGQISGSNPLNLYNGEFSVILG